MIPQLALEEVVYPFTPDEFVDNVLAPEVAICLILEDMNLDAVRYSRLYRRKQAYALLCASRDYGELAHPEPTSLSIHLLEESSWDDLEPWNDFDNDRAHEPMIESDTDEMKRQALRVAKQMAREGAVYSEDGDASAAEADDPDRNSEAEWPTTTTGGEKETVSIDGVYVFTADGDGGYVPPMRGAPTPYGVSHPVQVSNNDQERYSHARSPRARPNSQQDSLTFKAPRLKHIPTAAELISAHDLLQKKTEQRKAHAAQQLADKKRKDEEKRKEKERRVEERQSEQQEIADRRAAREERRKREELERTRQKAEKEKERRHKEWEKEDKRVDREKKKKAKAAADRKKEDAKAAKERMDQTRRQEQEVEKARKATRQDRSDDPMHVAMSKTSARPKPVQRRRHDVDNLSTIHEEGTGDGSHELPVARAPPPQVPAEPPSTSADNGIRARLRSRAPPAV